MEKWKKVDFAEVAKENGMRKRRLTVAAKSWEEDLTKPIDKERCKRDFAYWAARCVKIRDKLTGQQVPFVLNRAQRRVLSMMEKKRKSNKPIRLIMLKSRQWGGSTLIQIYMSWIQLVHRTNWHSVICAHNKDASRTIRSMYTGLLEDYPAEFSEDPRKKMSFSAFEGAQNIRIIKERNCRVTLASAEAQDAIRGSDISMAHMSEVAYWKTSASHDPMDFLRAVSSSIPLAPMTFLAIESTANGVGNFFHTEWLRAEKGESDKMAVFVPWYESDIYSLKLSNPKAFWLSLNAYERRLWSKHGCTLEQINWYRHKMTEYAKKEQMHAEFPTTPEEAFVNSDANVFSQDKIEFLRKNCREPERGEIGRDGVFRKDSRGELEVWTLPEAGGNYVVAVDVGARTERGDWSVIAAVRDGDCPEVVAQWRGHIDHDLLAEKAMRIATFYNEALLAIESNSLESADESTVSATVLHLIGRKYSRTYRRNRTRSNAAYPDGVGFHTNIHTKSLIINNLIEAVRESSYVERDHRACNELATYCRLPNGSYRAREGQHDDILMTRAIALYLISENQTAIPTPDDFRDAFPSFCVW